jgi:hypothetical protein
MSCKPEWTQLSSAERWALLRDYSINAALAMACLATAVLGVTLSRWW